MLCHSRLKVSNKHLHLRSNQFYTQKCHSWETDMWFALEGLYLLYYLQHRLCLEVINYFKKFSESGKNIISCLGNNYSLWKILNMLSWIGFNNKIVYLVFYHLDSLFDDASFFFFNALKKNTIIYLFICKLHSSNNLWTL